IPSTLAADGDALDVIVAAYDPAFPGSVVQVRPIGVLDMRDQSGDNRTVLAVPQDDPRFDQISDIDDLPESNLEEIEQFFLVYKRLEGDQDVEIGDWGHVDAAHELIESSRR
ncbi:MAG: inorganic diphosphatase, partial [Nitriliruptorales bacterium]|nr:inorganic diphosphatase [Nitriliruptorales bacterium]